MRTLKWNKIKNKKAKSFSRLGPDSDSNAQRNKRVIYQTNIMLNLQSPDGPKNLLENGYEMRKGVNICKLSKYGRRVVHS